MTKHHHRQAALDRDIRQVLDAFAAPAFVIGPRWDVEAFNQIADRLYRFDRGSGPFARNHIWRFFMDEDRRRLYLNWDVLAERAVGLLRTSYARCEGDRYLENLVGALIDGSPAFRELWKAQRTAPLTPDHAHLMVPGYGDIHVVSVRLPLPGGDDRVLFLLPPDDERSARVIAALAGRKRMAAKARPASRARQRR